jgi:hypothetical protein
LGTIPKYPSDLADLVSTNDDGDGEHGENHVGGVDERARESLEKDLLLAACQHELDGVIG